jgi:hypothetical protein
MSRQMKNNNENPVPAGDPSTITFLKEKVSYGARSGNIIF